MKRKSNVIGIGLIILYACLLIGGCGSERRKAKKELAREMSQRRNASIQSMKLYRDAMSEYEAGDIEKSHELLQESLNVNGRNTNAWMALSVLEYRNNNLFEAADAVNQALRMEPQRFEPHYNMGLIYETAGKYSKAITSYEKALELSPDEPAVMENLIRCYIRTDWQEEEVLALINRALLVEWRPEWIHWLEMKKTDLTSKGRV